jgi:hypothetical protein
MVSFVFLQILEPGDRALLLRQLFFCVGERKFELATGSKKSARTGC